MFIDFRKEKNLEKIIRFSGEINKVKRIKIIKVSGK